MPLAKIVLPRTHESISRPTAKSIVKDLVRITQLPETTPIVFLGNSTAPVQAGSALQDSNDSALLTSRSVINIEVSESYPDNTLMSTPVLAEEYMYCFKEPKLGIEIKPAYSRIETQVAIRARFQDRPSAEKWRDHFRMNSQNWRGEQMHEFSYHWEIPPVACVILYQLWACRERVAGYGEDIKTWMQAHLDPKATTIADLAGKNPLLVMSETQLGILGWFDFSGQPEQIQGNRELGTWEVSFTYTYAWSKPIAVIMKYPLVVHNQLIPKEIRPMEIPKNLSARFQTPGASTAYLNAVAKGFQPYYHTLEGISIPTFDDWLPDDKIGKYSTLARVLIKIDVANRRNVFDLQNIPSWEFEDDVITYLKSAHAGIPFHGGCMLKVTLYAGNVPKDDNFLTVDEDLKVFAAEDLDLRTVYHLVISLSNDLAVLGRSVIDNLLLHGTAALKLFKTLDRDIENFIQLPVPNVLGFIERADYRRVEKHLDGHLSTERVDDEYSHRLQATFTLVPRKRA